MAPYIATMIVLAGVVGRTRSRQRMECAYERNKTILDAKKELSDIFWRSWRNNNTQRHLFCYNS